MGNAPPLGVGAPAAEPGVMGGGKGGIEKPDPGRMGAEEGGNRTSSAYARS